MVRIFLGGLMSTAAYMLMVGCCAGLSGCGEGKATDGSMVKTEAPNLSPEQKAVHNKYYEDRMKKRGKAARKN